MPILYPKLHPSMAPKYCIFYVALLALMPALISCKKILQSPKAKYTYPRIFCVFKNPLTGVPSISNKLGIARDTIQGGKKRTIGHTLWTYLHLQERRAKEGSRGGAPGEKGSPEWLRVKGASGGENFKCI